MRVMLWGAVIMTAPHNYLRALSPSATLRETLRALSPSATLRETHCAPTTSAPLA
ncbi:MAG: hypothetical protein HDS39_00600 [Bacteroides sp.]|nr:hypothetical protein [Bacteroides sp.]